MNKQEKQELIELNNQLEDLYRQQSGAKATALSIDTKIEELCYKAEDALIRLSSDKLSRCKGTVCQLTSSDPATDEFICLFFLPIDAPIKKCGVGTYVDVTQLKVTECSMRVKILARLYLSELDNVLHANPKHQSLFIEALQLYSKFHDKPAINLAHVLETVEFLSSSIESTTND